MSRIRADLVVGGLWSGAYVCTEDGRYMPTDLNPTWAGVFLGRLAGEALISWREGEQPEAEDAPIFLRLDDPLGLGLAGLAARVGERIGCALHAHGSLAEVVDWWIEWRADDACPVAAEIAQGLHDGTIDYGEALCAISSLLAMTDALCAAVGLELAPGEVATWERWGGGWAVRVGGRVHAWSGPHVPDDWQAALAACLAEVAGE